MKTISGIVIAKNEEKMIEECLTSLSFCTELIVIDNGSEDKTLKIAKKMGARVFEFKTQDFSKLSTFGLEKATGEWILYFDAAEECLQNQALPLTRQHGLKNYCLSLQRQNCKTF